MALMVSGADSTALAEVDSVFGAARAIRYPARPLGRYFATGRGSCTTTGAGTPCYFTLACASPDHVIALERVRMQIITPATVTSQSWSVQGQLYTWTGNASPSGMPLGTPAKSQRSMPAARAKYCAFDGSGALLQAMSAIVGVLNRLVISEQTIVNQAGSSLTVDRDFWIGGRRYPLVITNGDSFSMTTGSSITMNQLTSWMISWSEYAVTALQR